MTLTRVAPSSSKSKIYTIKRLNVVFKFRGQTFLFYRKCCNNRPNLKQQQKNQIAARRTTTIITKRVGPRNVGTESTYAGGTISQINIFKLKLQQLS